MKYLYKRWLLKSKKNEWEQHMLTDTSQKYYGVKNLKDKWRRMQYDII